MATKIVIQLALGSLAVISIPGICNAAFTPADNYLINCGSSADTPVGRRVFSADNSGLAMLTAPRSMAADTLPNSVSGFDNSVLYQTARIFTAPSSYSFMIKNHGRHFVRLYFFPFLYQSYDLAKANFVVSTQDIVLLNNFTLPTDSSPVLKEYLLNIASDKLIVTFMPLGGLAFINAIEVISVPDSLITDSAETVNPLRPYLGLSRQPLETVYRINVGGSKIPPDNDTLWRMWAPDESFIIGTTGTRSVVYSGKLNYLTGQATQDDAPDSVYGTAREMVLSNKEIDSAKQMTWQFEVNVHFSYMIRLHFCDIVSRVPDLLYFNIFVDRWTVVQNLDLSTIGSGTLAFPYYMDVILPSGDPSGKLTVVIGASVLKNVRPDGILNGLEIMKMNIGIGSVGVVGPPATAQKLHLAVIVGSLCGGLAVVLIAAVLFVFFRENKKKLPPPPSSLPLSSWMLFSPSALSSVSAGSRTSNCTTTVMSVMSSNASYHIPFVTLQQATNDFDEDLVIGVGWFGKVYKGLLQDGTKVAVKRGNRESHQGMREFNAEIKLLSGLCHRHLVSLIGYCDENNEMILVYEYMEKGTVKSHLYGTDQPALTWKQRLEICIGSASGLQYLHTAFAKSIIHHDVKSANILLDENLMAKVSDFRFSKAGPEFKQTHVSTAVRGSYGYLDPEYLRRKKLTYKSDIYSFGVFLLEVACARPVIDPTLPREMANLAEWGMKCQKSGELERIIDRQIVGTIRPASLRKYGETVEKCLADDGVNRLTMTDVLWCLELASRLQEADLDISDIDSMNYIYELPPHPRLENSGEIGAEERAGEPVDYADTSMRSIFWQLVNAEGK